MFKLCKAGDIILIKKYKREGTDMTRHSFVVIGDEAGRIHGLEYNVICNIMSSFKDAAQRARKLSYPGNFEIKPGNTIINEGNDKDGFIKAEQFYYLNLDNDDIEYSVIGCLNADFYASLLLYIQELEIPIEHIIDNLK